jgi:hypothetical protein
MKQGRALTIANGVMCVIFAAFAVFQVNDPDSLAWILLYAVASLCCLLFVLGRLSPTFGGAVAVVALVWALFLAYFVITEGAAFTMADAAGERTREMFGLLIVAGWVGFVSRRTTLRKRLT